MSHLLPEHPHHAQSIPLLPGCKGTQEFPKDNEKWRKVCFPQDTCLKVVPVTWGTWDLLISSVVQQVHTQVLETSTSPEDLQSFSSNWALNKVVLLFLSAFSLTDIAPAISSLQHVSSPEEHHENDTNTFLIPAKRKPLDLPYHLGCTWNEVLENVCGGLINCASATQSDLLTGICHRFY